MPHNNYAQVGRDGPYTPRSYAIFWPGRDNTEVRIDITSAAFRDDLAGFCPPFPEGFQAKPSPFGVGFTGTACSEERLLELAFAFEQATKRRVPPQGAP